MSQTDTAVELSPIPAPTQHVIDPEPDNLETSFPDSLSNLPPTDGGSEAWRLLLAAFVFEALLWGFPLSFGVFQDYYTTIPEFENDPYTSIVGSTASGISYLGAPLILPLIKRWPRYRTRMILVGWPMCIMGLVAGSSADRLSTLTPTQGIMYGLDFIMFYYPILTMVNEYWVRRRGMAYGFLCSASGASGAVMPLVLQALLKRYGYRTTLRAVAVSLAVLTGPLILLLKGRVAPWQQPNVRLRTDWSFLKLPLFWTYSVSNVLMGLGYFFPALYLPSYASSINLSTVRAALLLSLMSVAQVAGQFTFGYLSDTKIPLNALMLISLLVAAVATLSSWGAASSFPPLIIFAILYGFFGTGYTALWARMVTAVSEEPSASEAMFGLFNFGKGVGNVMAGPISAGLLKLSTHTGAYGQGTYESIILFTGACLLLSAGSLGTVFCTSRRYTPRYHNG